MPDTTHAREALRRLAAGLIRSGRVPPLGGRTDDDVLAMLGTDEAADLQLVLDALDDAMAERPRFVYAAKDRDFGTGGARGLLVIDLASVDVHCAEADVVASCTSTLHARTLTRTLNEHPPVPDYDIEPF